MNYLCLSLLVQSALAVPITAESEKASWNQFRGRGSQGIADDTSYPETFDDPTRIRWQVSVPLGHSSPCVAGDYVFLTGATESELVILCIGRTDGKVRWRKALPLDQKEKAHEINSLASPTPACDGERVYVYFGSFGLLCLDLDGAEIWRRELPVAENTFGTGASPTLAGDRLIFINDQRERPYLEVIDGPTGETIWRRDREGFGSGWSTPVVRRAGDVDELIVYGVWWLTAYDLKDGSERWAVPGLADEPCITPALGEGMVFVTSYNMKTNSEVIGLPEFSALLEAHDKNEDATLSKSEAGENKSILSRHDADGEGDHPLRIFFRFLDQDKNGQIDANEWEKIISWVGGFKQKNAVVAIRPGDRDQSEAEIVWQFKRGIPECPSPLYSDGRLYLIKNGGILTCLRASDGDVLFQHRLGGGGPYYASPVAADGKVYLTSARGTISVIDAGETFRQISNSNLDARIMATPALADGLVFIRTDTTLLAYGA